MADLIAQGPQPTDRWRRHLPPGETLILGRTADGWSVPWDDQVSRVHAELRLQGQRLAVVRKPSARNAIFYRGLKQDDFHLTPGEHFVIGQTTFTLAEEAAAISVDAPQPLAEQTYAAGELQRLRFRNADQRLDVLSRLPDVISGASNDEELFVRLVNMLLAGVLRADAAALVEVVPADDGDQERVRILHWDRRMMAAGDFQPSHRLITEAIRKRQQSVVHVWRASAQAPRTRGERTGSSFTMTENADWAFCTPVPGLACQGWGLYLAGRYDAPMFGVATPTDRDDLRDDVKFTELVAAIFNSLRQIQKLQRQQTTLSHFFSPVVMRNLAGEDPELGLQPRETEVSVLFCDLRGFSRASEQLRDDLLGLLERVSEALGVMTHQILKQGGVIGDFQGDAAMGFWGWPLPAEDAPLRAAQAALGIRREFEAFSRQKGHPLAGFRMGIGVATGRAVAGKIGTRDQGKVTVFGPVVNLASRLEGMTKVLQAPILLDETTAARVRQQHDSGGGWGRCRRLGVFKPYGLDQSVAVSELLPPAGPESDLSDEDLTHYEQAVESLVAGHWDEAFQRLHRVPPSDRVKDFLTVYIAQHGRQPPAGWDGVIPMQSK